MAVPSSARRKQASRRPPCLDAGVLEKGRDQKGERRYAKVDAALNGKPLEEKGLAAAMHAVP